MINVDLWQHICEARTKAYYLIAQLPEEQRGYAKTLVEAIDAIYYDYREDFE